MLRNVSRDTLLYKKWKVILDFHVQHAQPRCSFKDTFRWRL